MKDFTALYQQSIARLEADRALCEVTGKRLNLGYTSNLDIVLKWDEDAFSRIIDEFLCEAPRRAPGDTVAAMADFARIALAFLKEGAGGEVDITDAAVSDELERRFETAYALGGTCAQGAAALGSVGLPVTAYITDRSTPVCALIDRPGMALYANGRLAPVHEAASGEPPVKHIILQYPKGATVRARGETHRAPVSDRLILDYDAIHKVVPIDPGFLQYCEDNAADCFAYGVSGFNGILDPAILTERLSCLTRHYAAFHARNPGAVIYLEGACYLNPAVRNLAFDALAHSVDVLGMNEEELTEHAARFGAAPRRGDMESILAALTSLLARYPARGIVLHTRDYAMYFGRDIPGADFAKGLALGNLMSATRARTGRYGTPEDCAETLNQVPLSQAGLAMAAALHAIDPIGHVAVLVPSRALEHPAYTIGLGDTFTAGMLTAFIHEGR